MNDVILSGLGILLALCGMTVLIFRRVSPIIVGPLAALTFAASSIICAFGLASAAPRSPYRHLELCGIALTIISRT